MKRIEDRLATCVETAQQKGYTITNLRVHYQRNCTVVTIRLKLFPAPYRPGRGMYGDGMYGSIEAVEKYVQELEQL